MDTIQIWVILGGSTVAALGVLVLLQDRLMDQYCRNPATKCYTISQLAEMSARKAQRIALRFWLGLVSSAFFASWFMTWLTKN